MEPLEAVIFIRFSGIYKRQRSRQYWRRFWQTEDPFSRQRERPTSTILRLSGSNIDLGLKLQMGALFQDRLAD
jgi:hypothetical protein